MIGEEHAVAPDVAANVSEELKQSIEVLIFASDEPLTVQMIRDVIDEGNQQREPSGRLEASNGDVHSAVTRLNREYEEAQRSFRIVQLAGGYVFATNKKFSMWVGKLFKEKARRKLSATAIETLAIIAYKQPITKSEVEFIRGVNADYIMRALLEKNLATIVGRASTPGRPLLYGTTPEFLRHFGLNEITDLPKPREIEELIGETELEVDRRLLAEQQEIEFKEQLQEKLEPGQRKEKTSGRKKAEPVHQQAPPQKPQLPSADAAPEAALTVEEPIMEIAPAVELESPVEAIIAGAVRVEEEPVGVAEVSAGTGEISTPEQAAAVQEKSASPAHPDDAPQKGWSKWKTKLQTFFRKLFA
jgi:segregation and condensation protein B